MKKIIAFIIFLCTQVHASQTVPIIWAFSPASNQANALRVIIDNANKAQTKYNFVFEHKPGAGGSIAVNHLIRSSSPTLLMMSTTIFTRPYYYRNQSYDVNDIQPVVIASTNSPIAILSTKFTSIEDIKNNSVKIGIVQGSITESVAKALQNNLNSEVILVPYQASINATNDLMGGHIDASVEFIKDSIPWVESNKANIIGITGSTQIDKYKTLSTQSISGTENLISNYYVVANKSITNNMLKEFHEIITSAMIQDNVIEVWKGDYAKTTKRTYQQTLEFWNNQKQFWK